ncbi:MAG: hypothetical protein KF831_15360 [Acidobacteria bacterium]|nr:hypothetical protein [Acidobacteriota bacterium]
MSEIDFEQGKFGVKATIKTKWKDSLIDLLVNRDIRELELNIGKGWRGKNIEFLKELPHLRSLVIGDLTLELIEPIHYLHELIELELETYSDSPVNFNAFPKLTSCWFEWIKGSDSLFDCRNLKSLGVNNYKKKSSEPFSRLMKLEQLALLNSPVEDLAGLYELKNLKELRIARLSKITDLGQISLLKELKILDIGTCKGIRSVSEVFFLGKLKALFLSNIGDIETLRGIESLTELEQLIFDESTNIVDGDLSPILSLKRLKKISFQNRRHYTHRREDFEKLYFGS